MDEPVTVADAQSNRCFLHAAYLASDLGMLRSVFVNGLRQRFPNIAVLSEEADPPHHHVDLSGVSGFVHLEVRILAMILSVHYFYFVLQDDPLLDLSRILVVIDPLDATKAGLPHCAALFNFFHDAVSAQEFTEDLLDYVTTMMCVTLDGRPIAGLEYLDVHSCADLR